MCVPTYSDDRVPWLYSRFFPDEDFPSDTENEEYSEGMPESYSSEERFSSQSSPPYWEDDIDNTCSPSSSPALQISPVTEEQDSVEKQAELLSNGDLGQGLQDGSHLVELSTAVTQRESIDHTTCPVDGGDRCKGWGAYCQGLRAGGPWQIVERNQHINMLELKSALLALQTFVATKCNMHILLWLDNRTAIAYIN